MLLLRLICIGKLKEDYWRQAVAEYKKRLEALCRFEIAELPEARLPQAPTPGQVRQALEQEGEEVIKKITGTAYPLCIEGKQVDSQGLAGLLGKAMEHPGAVTFIIGSSYGLSPAVKCQGEGLSMSAMTFPHQLARVMLCEQLYRGMQILRGAKYHK